MKEFDWDFAKKVNSPAKLQWIWDNHKRKVSVDEFVLEIKKLRKLSFSKKPRKRYTPSSLRKRYKNLKEKFGFFTGKLK